MLIVILSNHSHRSQGLTIPNLKLEIWTKTRYSLHTATLFSHNPSGQRQ